MDALYPWYTVGTITLIIIIMNYEFFQHSQLVDLQA